MDPGPTYGRKLVKRTYNKLGTTVFATDQTLHPCCHVYWRGNGDRSCSPAPAFLDMLLLLRCMTHGQKRRPQKAAHSACGLAGWMFSSNLGERGILVLLFLPSPEAWPSGQPSIESQSLPYMETREASLFQSEAPLEGGGSMHTPLTASFFWHPRHRSAHITISMNVCLTERDVESEAGGSSTNSSIRSVARTSLLPKSSMG